MADEPLQGHIKPSGHINKQFARWEPRERGGWQYLARDRREFITLLGGVAAAWPLSAGARQGENIRRICVLTAGVGAADPDAQAGNAAFVLALQQLGWTSGGNLRIDYFWGSGQDDLAALASDVILASGTASLAALLQATRMVPIVFVIAAGPGRAGLLYVLGHPVVTVTDFWDCL